MLSAWQRLAGRQKQLGEAHQETITSMQRYAELLEQKERGQVEAEELWRRVVAAGRLSAISGLAQNLRRQQLPEATELVKSHAERLQVGKATVVWYGRCRSRASCKRQRSYCGDAIRRARRNWVRGITSPCALVWDVEYLVVAMMVVQV